MESLDEDCLQEIFSRCQVKDILRLQQVCKRFYSIICISELIWTTRLWRDLGLGLQRQCENSEEKCCSYETATRIFKYVMDPDSGDELRFRGVYTNGGVDGSNLGYWVDNLFQWPDETPYCSNRSRNVDCIGILLEENEEEKRRKDNLLLYMRSRCRFAAAMLEQVRVRQGNVPQRMLMDIVSEYSEVQLETFFLHLCEEIEEVRYLHCR